MNELFERNYILAVFGLSQFICMGIALILSGIDKRKVNGINVWIKPSKFFLSVAIFSWTMGWLMYYLPAGTDVRKFSIWFVIMLGSENAMITFQAARGIKSHFNVSGLFNGMIFNVMGIIITLSTILTGYIGVLFFKSDVLLPAPYLLGIRIAFILFTIASFEGFIMASRLKHSVKGEDSDRGIPFLNWNKKAGDIHISHSIGLHALQFLPLAGYIAFMYVSHNAVALVWIFSMLYSILWIYTLINALRGKPLPFFSKARNN